jgi:plasmid stability protein
MATLTIRNIPDDVKLAIRKRAAERGVSMEQEAREALARGAAAAHARRKPSIEAMAALGVKPSQPFDLKALSDELWEEGLR